MEYMHKIKLETEIETYDLIGYRLRPRLKLVFFQRIDDKHWWEVLYKHDISDKESMEEIQKEIDDILPQLPDITKPCEGFEFEF